MKDLTLRQFKKTIASAAASLIFLTAPGLPCLAALAETNLASEREGQIDVEAAGEELAASFPAQTADMANQSKRPISYKIPSLPQNKLISAMVKPSKSLVAGALDAIDAFFFASVAQVFGKR